MSLTYIPFEVRSDGQVNLQHRAGDGLHVCTELQAREVVDEPVKGQQEITGVLTIHGSVPWLCHMLL